MEEEIEDVYSCKFGCLKMKNRIQMTENGEG